MVSSTIAILVVVTAAAAEPADLVKQLGSQVQAERKTASDALEALGRKALPALRGAARSKDKNLRERALALLDKIESGLLIKPTPVSLDFQERPLAEVVKAIDAQTGFRLALEPADDPAWQSLRVTLREPRPLPFWEALDRLGAAGQVRHDPGFRAGATDRAPVFRLRAGSGNYPKWFSGPFRVNLVSIHRGHDVAFGPKEEAQEDEEPDLERFEVQAQVFAEPHLMISLGGPPKELQARDDFDQDLVPPPPEPMEDDNAPPANAAMSNAPPGDAPLPGTLSIVQFPIALRAPDRPGTTIDRLEGFIPLQVASRKPDPLVATLAEAGGKTFKNDEVMLRFPDGQIDLSPRAALELEVTFPERPEAMPAPTDPPPPDFPEPRPVDTLQNRIEILDAEGHPLIWTIRNAAAGDEGTVQVSIGFSIRNGKRAPAKLLYYGLTQAAVEVPFKFTKIPIP